MMPLKRWIWYAPIFVFLFFTSGICQKTMNEARPDIRLLLSSTNTETRFYTDAQVDTAWARAIRVVAMKAEVAVQRSDSFFTAVNNFRYSLNSTLLKLRAAWKRSGANLKLLFITNDPYLNVRLGSQMPAEFGYVHSDTVVFKIKLTPVPTAIETVYYDYYARPTVPTAAGNATDMPEILLPALVYEAAAWLINADYKQTVSAQFHGMAVDLALTYKNLFISQGNLPLAPGGSTEK